MQQTCHSDIKLEIAEPELNRLRNPILFVFGSQACIPNDPLRAAKALNCDTVVFARQAPCGLSGDLVDIFQEVDLSDLRGVLEAARGVHQQQPLRAVVGYDDEAVPIVAHIATELGLPGHPIEAANASRDKCAMKRRFADARIPIAPYMLADDEDDAVAWANRTGYPVVVKPVRGSASQGVIRADDESQLREAYRRLRRIVRLYGLETGGRTDAEQLVETYLDGSEFSVEVFVRAGQPEVLCVFEKPLPLHGPFFEETIYVCPPRVTSGELFEMEQLSSRAVRALGLQNGPAHCELRLSSRGLFVLEIAARLIGGACSRVFRYLFDEDIHRHILKLALGEAVRLPSKRAEAAGALMLPLPGEGRLAAVEGVEKAKTIPGIRDVIFTGNVGDMIVPFPEQGCYVGFATASGADSNIVMDALCKVARSIELRLDAINTERWSLEIASYVPHQTSATCDVLVFEDFELDEAREKAQSAVAWSYFGELPQKLAQEKAKEYLEHVQFASRSSTAVLCWVGTEPEGAALAWADNGSVYLACLAVRNVKKDLHIAETLLQYMIGKFVRRGCETLRIDVDPRHTATTHLYRRLGFVRVRPDLSRCHA